MWDPTPPNAVTPTTKGRKDPSDRLLSPSPGRTPLHLLIALALALTGCRTTNLANPATTYQNIQTELRAGNLDKAQREAQEARTRFPQQDWPITFQLLQAKALTYQGLSPQVIALLACDGNFPATGDLAIQQKLLCSLAHIRLNQPDKSATELHGAQQLAEATHSPLQAEAAQTEGLIERHNHRLPEAKAAFEKSLSLNQDPYLEASDLLNLGFVALQQEHYDEASALFKQAAGKAKPIHDRTVTEAALGNLGVAYYYLGDYEKALTNFQQASHESEAIGTTSAQIDWLWDACSSNYRLGKIEEARRCYEQALQAATAIDDRESIAGIDTELASLLYEQGLYEAAAAHVENAFKAAQTSGDKSAQLDPRFVQALLATHQQPKAQADPEELLTALYRDAAESPSLRWEVENALANLYTAHNQSQQAEQWYRRSLQTFEAQRASVQDEELKLPFFANGNTLYRDYADYLIAANRPNEALQLLDLGRARTLEEGLNLTANKPQLTPMRNTNFQPLAARLNAVILFYSLGPNKSYLWAITPQRTALFTLPRQSEIEPLIQRYQAEILESADPLHDAKTAAATLYDQLVKPAAGMIPRDARVYLIPDGPLNKLNFETLITTNESGPHFWIEDVTVTSTNSIHLLSQLNTTPAKATGLLLIGNPIAPAQDYENLPNAPAEIASVQKHFPGETQTALTQAQATPAAYTASDPARYAYIHFVAHGTASQLSPLDSAVILSAPPGRPGDYKLYARDIVHTPLHAQLVIISACYGSGTRAYDGEGLVGLAWAFLRAGAHNVIAALWEANDASTPVLMDRLYAEIEVGRRPDEALRAAKLSLIHSTGVYRKPLYWAAFQLYAGS